MSRLTVFSLCAALCGVMHPASAADTAGDAPQSVSDAGVAGAIESAVRHVFESTAPAVVRVESEDELGKIAGTGFFTDADGTIYTLASLVGDGTEITVTTDGSKKPARLLAKDTRSGIALVKIETKHPKPFLVKNTSDTPVLPATPLVLVGFPFDLAATPSFGVVGGLDRQSRGKFFATTHIRANIPVQRGQGGSPVLNLRGDVVGVVVSGLEGGGGCYVLPIAAAEKLRSDYARFGETRHGWAGVTLQEIPQAVHGSRMAIDTILPGGPAAQEFRAGDVVLQIGDFSVHDPEDAVDAAFFLTAGDPIKVRVSRNGEILEVPFTPGEHPFDRKTSMQAMGSGGLMDLTRTSLAP